MNQQAERIQQRNALYIALAQQMQALQVLRGSHAVVALTDKGIVERAEANHAATAARADTVEALDLDAQGRAEHPMRAKSGLKD